jgi:hypothetical protein
MGNSELERTDPGRHKLGPTNYLRFLISYNAKSPAGSHFAISDKALHKVRRRSSRLLVVITE